MSLSTPLRIVRLPLASSRLCAGRRPVRAQLFTYTWRLDAGHQHQQPFSSTQSQRADTPPKSSDLPTESVPETTPSTALSAPSYNIEANPPPTTRPPPLNLPTREPDTSTATHLYRTGRAYLTFYKTGLRQIYTNHQLVQSLRNPSPSSSSSAATTTNKSLPEIHPNTRAAHLLTARHKHDIARLPLFALFLLVFGEFTPLILIAFPKVVPYTCRIPAQITKVLTSLEERRRVAFRELDLQREDAVAREADRKLGRGGRVVGAGGIATADDTTLHEEKGLKQEDGEAVRFIPRTLGLTSPLWDKAGLTSPLSRRKTQSRLAWLATDDTLLVKAGGVFALEDDEVKLACVDRGIDVSNKPVQELRRVLEKWLEVSVEQEAGKGGAGVDEAVKKNVMGRIGRLLLYRPEKW